MLEQTTLGTLFIIAAPSGGGKTSLVKRLLELDPQLKLSVSHTTRSIRTGEVHAEDYFFVSQRTFLEMIEKNIFLEHAIVFGQYYGTSKEQVLSSLQRGLDVILEIDWQGAQQVRQLFENVISIFILPPSYEVLAQRLAARGQDSEAVIHDRMKKARNEISHYHEFDYLVFNETFEICLQQLQSIILAQRLSYQQQIWRSADKLAPLLS